MKRVVCFILVGLAAFSLQAQGYINYSLEVSAGAGFGRGPQALVEPQFVAQYGLGGGFKIGAGVGIRAAKPCFQYVTRNGESERNFCNEVDVPLFLRLGFGGEKLFAQIDAGYALSAISLYGSDYVPGGKKDPCYKGLFVEPQIGWNVGSRSSLALGILLQKSAVMDHVTTMSGSALSPSVTGTVQKQELFTPAITLRYGWRF